MRYETVLVEGEVVDVDEERRAFQLKERPGDWFRYPRTSIRRLPAVGARVRLSASLAHTVERMVTLR